MRNVILYMMMTVDGYIAGPNGELDWMVTMDDEPAIEMGLLDQVDTALIGHGSYGEMAAYWTSAAKNSDASQAEVDFANKINAVTKLVFSTTEEKLDWTNARQVMVKDDGELAEAVMKLKAQPGKDMVLYGGARLAQTFVNRDLIDEYRLVVHPVLLGNGKRLFQGGQNRQAPLKLVRTKHDASGVMLLCYQPV